MFGWAIPVEPLLCNTGIKDVHPVNLVRQERGGCDGGDSRDTTLLHHHLKAAGDSLKPLRLMAQGGADKEVLVVRLIAALTVSADRWATADRGIAWRTGL
jgi:hypothetical protein